MCIITAGQMSVGGTGLICYVIPRRSQEKEWEWRFTHITFTRDNRVYVPFTVKYYHDFPIIYSIFFTLKYCFQNVTVKSHHPLWYLNKLLHCKLLPGFHNTSQHNTSHFKVLYSEYYCEITPSSVISLWITVSASEPRCIVGFGMNCSHSEKETLRAY